MRTLIIVPAYNEEDALPDTLRELRRAQPDADVAVVDDGSRDDTAAVARAGGAVVLTLPFNLGVGAAVRTGLRCAAARGYERAVVVDADGQHDPEGVAELLAALDAGADLAIGSRFAAGAPEYVTGRVRRRAMRLLQRIVRIRTGQDFTDVTSGYRGFSRRVIELLAAEYPAEFLADTVEAILIVHDNGGTIVEVPVRMRARGGDAVDPRHRTAVELPATARRDPQLDRLPAAQGRVTTKGTVMSTTAHVLVLVLAIAAALLIVRLVAMRQLRSKYALLWLTIAVALVPLAAVPSLLNDVAHGLGFSYAPALLFLLAIGFLFAVVVYLSWELSRMEARIRLLAERMAIEGADPPPGQRER